jgi:hypothetical protein
MAAFPVEREGAGGNCVPLLWYGRKNDLWDLVRFNASGVPALEGSLLARRPKDRIHARVTAEIGSLLLHVFPTPL